MDNTIIQPPPFMKGQEIGTENQEAENKDHVLDTLGLDSETQKHIQEMLQDAETQGYLRGRNEKIEATQHFDSNPELEPHPIGIPLYNRRSIWD